ncbi:MAG: DNA cytosine methyltransferase [Chloroflexi bacterium]|nr:DNA cytosine methyltransferase [Chloroflexota bacterium]
MSSPFRVVSAFSGAMGLDLGLEQTWQFEVIACIEHDPACCATIERNRDAGRLKNPNMRLYSEDIRRVRPAQLLHDFALGPGDLDLLVGGPPCQSFSTAGRRGTVQDVRGLLLWEFLEYIVELRPRFFLMENVRGLVSAALRHRPISDRPENGGPPLSKEEQPGSVLRAFLEDLDSSAPEYRVDCFEVNAVNYGAPQLRERFLMIGNRLNHLVEFPEPTHGQSDRPDQPGLFGEPQLLPYRTLGDAIRGLREADPVLMDFSPRKKSYLGLVKPGGNWRTLPTELQAESMGAAFDRKGGRSGWWRRLSFDLPCPTVVTMPNHAGTSMCHPEEIRALTLRECALVQEFPAEWEFAGSPQEQYAQVGNAVPVRLGRVAGSVLAEHLAKAESEGFRTRPGDHPRIRLVYLQSHVRTRQWFKDGLDFSWSDGSDNDQAAYRPPRTRRKVRSLG